MEEQKAKIIATYQAITGTATYAIRKHFSHLHKNTTNFKCQNAKTWKLE